MFTRLSSYAQDFAPNGATVPMRRAMKAAGRLSMPMSTRSRSDLDFRKTIPGWTGMLRVQRLL